MYAIDKFYASTWKSSHTLQATREQLPFHSCKMIHYKDSCAWLSTLDFYILFHNSYITGRNNEYLSLFISTIALKLVLKIIGMLAILPHIECR